MIYPDYKNNIVNIAGSIEKYFDLKSEVSSLGEIDEVLNTYKPKNVVVILFDGMGYNLINEKLPNTFLVNNIVNKANVINDVITKIYYPINLYLSLINKFDVLKLLKLILINIVPFIIFIYLTYIPSSHHEEYIQILLQKSYLFLYYRNKQSIFLFH